MNHKLIPIFILSEAVLTVNNTDMIHLNKSSIDEHAIICPKSYLRIRIHLHGIFSCLSAQMPTPDEIIDPASRDVVITPEGAS